MIVLMLAATADGKKPAPAPAPVPAPVPAPAPPEEPSFLAWAPEERAQAWQGSWVVKENGTVQAWTIAGDQVQVWDGTAEKTFRLDFESPCRAMFWTPDGMGMPRPFSVTDGKLRFRAGGGGYVKGDEALFCEPGGDTLVLAADGTCTAWSRLGSWEKKPTTCAVATDAAGVRTFSYEGSQEPIAIEGVAILSRTSMDITSYPDHAAARAARDAAK